MALYVNRVPQTGALPTASFRFHLTMDTLAVQLMVATANPIADFHCQAIFHARRSKKDSKIIPIFFYSFQFKPLLKAF